MNNFGKLRDIQDSELEMMLSWRNNKSVRVNMYNSEVISLNEHLNWWARINENKEKKYFMYEFIGKPLGIIGITDISLKNNHAAWAFYASPDAPKGTGSKMEFLALEYVFTDLGLHKLWCEVLAFNQPVIKLHSKFGFKQEGVFRDHHYSGADYVDVYRLGILKNEWSALREVMKNKLLRLSGIKT